eukprot:8188260-Pyramimonas_sp.AAC.1
MRRQGRRPRPGARIADERGRVAGGGSARRAIELTAMSGPPCDGAPGAEIETQLGRGSGNATVQGPAP